MNYLINFWRIAGIVVMFAGVGIAEPTVKHTEDKDDLHKAPIVAVDVTNGQLPGELRDELLNKKCEIREIQSPLTLLQLKDVTAVILGAFRIPLIC